MAKCFPLLEGKINLLRGFSLYLLLLLLCILILMLFYHCRIHMAPFSDEFLFIEMANKVQNVTLFLGLI